MKHKSDHKTGGKDKKMKIARGTAEILYLHRWCVYECTVATNKHSTYRPKWHGMVLCMCVS